MRVIAGTAKGRRLRAGKGLAVRPTSDKVKGAIFNILASRYDLEGAHVLDLFAGSGNLGIESLSRGAAQVIFVEQSTDAARVLRANLDLCRMAGQGRILRAAVQRALAVLAAEGARFDGVLIDPPYGRGLVDKTLTTLAATRLPRPGGWILLEHHVDEPPAERYGQLRLTQARHY